MDCENRDCNNRDLHGSRDPCWFVKKHLDKVNWHGLSGNTSVVDKPLNIKGARR